MGTKKPVQSLRKSKKYAIGAEHETGGGRIRILDRFLEDGEIMLRYMNLNTRKDIINKEKNVNRLVYDYQQKKKAEAYEEIVVNHKPEVLLEGPSPVKDPKALVEQVQPKEEEISVLKDEINSLTEIISSLKDEITSLRGEVASISENSGELIKKQFALIEKLVGK
ncbi:hypothetical protein P4K49_30685 [Bacillus cereus]|uniref:Uncharacterized protein n=2 Tax=Bacillus cereus group TaxID=86661 RepID=A0A9X6Z623_BACTU|nr:MULTISPECIES: hypothetical protein [Bacillus cereus group]MCU5278274.1 hypothetical protein [Bacillus cereus]AMR85262.1 hypothetical protein A3L20_14935 [Bacillus thuringiensis]MBG9637723.1 hypothetical protein [Bacillus thuringiensis]MBG9637868.1 hypothetical protein [Bacillus thuringiensis]MBG9674948.1 hypothetical protein [Bacillus thuringiensis]